MLVKRSLLLAGGVALAIAWGSQGANAQGVFTITSKSFKDGERLQTKMAGNNKQNPNCVGDNVSPELSWSNLPAGTKSYALLMFDPEGRPPGGVSHWVAYGIPASVTGFAEGEASKQTDKYVGGKSLMGLAALFRPVHAARPLASLHLHADGHRPRADRAPARPDAGRADQGARGQGQAGDRHHRHLLEAVSRSSPSCPA